MKSRELSSSLLLLVTALIWGLAFVAQREGAKVLSTFSFNGIRFALGALSLSPVIIFMQNREKNIKASMGGLAQGHIRVLGLAGISCGLVLFAAASLQQLGMSDTIFGQATSAGKAAFITGFYIPLVPIVGLFFRQKISWPAWIGIVVSLFGLYLLSITSDFTVSGSDVLVLIGALFWTAHILLIDHFSQRCDALLLACLQFLTCSVLSLIIALGFEKPSWEAIRAAAYPLLFGGIASVGIAYTLQVIGQKHVRPSSAALLLSLETVFASLGGLIILGELMSGRALAGCALMLAGILVSQLKR